MATIDFTAASVDFDMTDAGSADFAAYFGTHPTYYDWTNSNGQIIYGNGFGFSTNAMDMPVTGTFTNFYILGATITGISVDVSEFHFAAGQLSTDFFWYNVVNGDDTFLFDTDVDLELYGDFNVLPAGAFAGGNDTFSGDTTIASKMSGDVAEVTGGVLIGGDDLFNVSGGRIYGDAFEQTGGTIIGGDDVFTYNDNYTADQFFIAFGDVDEVLNGAMIGGDDTIDASASTNETSGQVELGWTITGAGIVGDATKSSFAYIEGGQDNLIGTQSGDIIVGDVVDVDAFSTVVAGDDTIEGKGGADLLIGDVYQSLSDAGYGTTEYGDDIINGGNGNDVIHGDFVLNADASEGGNDILNGGKGSDTIFGDGGNDIISGGKGNDVLRGGHGQDEIFGNGGHDRLFGGKGSDELTGGTGNDKSTGGKGSDLFIFSNGWGNDVITDFDANDNNEEIDLSGVGAITGWADLSNNHMSQVGADVVIDDGLGNTITLLNVDLGDLNNTDFVF